MTSRAMVERIDWREPRTIAIAAVLGIGALLRAYLIVRWRPAFVNYSDTGIYIQDAFEGGFADPLRVAGYGIFLIPLHWISAHMLPVILIQHALGLGTAVLLYMTLRLHGAPWSVALVPMAVVALGGTQIFLEHSLLSEALFTFLVALALYAASRDALDGSPWWTVAAGACVGLCATVRGVGTALVAVVPVWLLFASHRVSRGALVRAGTALAVSLLVIGGYVGWRTAQTDQSGFTSNGNWNVYGRVAPFADCTKFDPPAGTRALCDPVPPKQRVGRNVEYYIYDPDSPAQQAFGPPYLVSPDPDANSKLGKFAFAAIRGQPGAYLNAVGDDLVRIVAPDNPSDGDISYDQLIRVLVEGPFGNGRNDFVESWRNLYYPGDVYHWSNIEAMRDYEQITRVQGPLMVIVLLLALAAPWITPFSVRRLAVLMAATAFALLVYPILTHAYDARFVVPALGPLSAAAALGGWGIFEVIQRWRTARATSRSAASPPPAESTQAPVAT